MVGRAATDFYIVQHGEKQAAAGDPPLSAAGVEQARLTARYLKDKGIARIVCSPLRRARETARFIAGALGLPVRLDDRLRERMNWGDGPTRQTLDEFLAEWRRATAERDFTPASGDSSRAAGARLRALLEELAREQAGGHIVLVAHGGVTVDLLRDLFPDESLRRLKPDPIEAGIGGCAITHLVKRKEGYALRALGSVAHLPVSGHTPHRP